MTSSQLVACHEKCWDTLIAAALAASLLNSTPNNVGQARLLATSAKVSDAWLLTMPVTALGLIDDYSGARPGKREEDPVDLPVELLQTT